jgi:4-hydroxybenzoate polyprenyltransferase
MRIAPIAVLIVLALFAKWELAIIVILALFVAIGWSALRKRRSAPSGPPTS